jgi:hypothetical protein
VDGLSYADVGKRLPRSSRRKGPAAGNWASIPSSVPPAAAVLEGSAVYGRPLVGVVIGHELARQVGREVMP